ncbi:hypothetical protein AK88_00114 [Plasmodium fragile]|uniref:Ribosomal protein S14 n=1 Tax=Plasmodium fragile TaxID=5857 RepID=A0A0D9QUE5_PLAFR|nr:uncharacterized protein AK88_00114 [Plasmodium fragile]KJP90266.1 hypothetical protein AK88_00114 [Plasmodium fragile]
MLKFIKFCFVYLVLTNAKKTRRTNEKCPLLLFLYGSTTYGAKRWKSQSGVGKITPLHLKKRLDPNDKYTVIKRHEAKVQRNLKRKYLIERYKEKRQLLKKYIAEASSPIEYVYWKYKLSSLPRDSCPAELADITPSSVCADTKLVRSYRKCSSLVLSRHVGSILKPLQG